MNDYYQKKIESLKLEKELVCVAINVKLFIRDIKVQDLHKYTEILCRLDGDIETYKRLSEAQE